MRWRGALVLGMVSALLGGCADGTADDTLRIAFLLPESKTARYESHDRPAFEERIAELCPTCETLYGNANQDAARQQAQAEAAITNGADVLVLDPVDSVAAAVIANQARAAGLPVIAYDRLVLDAPIDFHLTSDNERVGELQAQSLVAAVRAQGRDGDIVMLNGAPTDDNAGQFKAGAHRIFDAAAVTVGAEFDVPDWSPDQAQERMERAVAALGRNRIVGVYAANDGMAAGAIAAMRAAGLDPLPPVTGQDAELAAIQRILLGEQHMTVYKFVRRQAEVAAEMALTLARGEDLPADVVTTHVDNGAGLVPTLELEPIAVTADTIRATVVAEGYWSVAEICEPRIRAACDAVGLR
jgi:D-xylose transport system substrate-binding protein